MAKESQRSNRETRKPKTKKTVAPTSSSASIFPGKIPPTSTAKKKADKA